MNPLDVAKHLGSRPSYEGRGLKSAPRRPTAGSCSSRPSYEGRGLKCPTVTNDALALRVAPRMRGVD